jgi:hypothetical protein
MRNRVGLVATGVLILTAAAIFWSPSAWRMVGPAPVITPPLNGKAVDTPITSSFGTAPALPSELSDEAFWRMIREFSEPGGYFMYENFLSNERSYQVPIPSLIKSVKSGGVYLGVGPEQNFTYIAAVRPQMAFVVDIRRQNMVELLMYKALFSMAPTRAEFVSLLFSRAKPTGLDERSTAEDLFESFSKVRPDRQLFQDNLKLLKEHLPALASEDQETIEYVYNVFFSVGPDLSYSSVSPGPSGPTYEQLMTFRDGEGRNWSYLASEERYQYLKEMQRQNLIIPIVGDFAGPKAIRTVARYLKDHSAVVTAFYLSNVEMYILPSPQWKAFCANVAALPVAPSSRFIRFVVGGYARYLRRDFGSASLISPIIDVLTGETKGYPPSYYDLLRASR